jgi:hypothetical protein
MHGWKKWVLIIAVVVYVAGFPDQAMANAGKVATGLGAVFGWAFGLGADLLARVASGLTD